jgi:hypothetical protein
MKSLRFILFNLFEDFKRLNPGVKGLDRDLVTIEARLKDEGYGFLTIALPAFGKSIDSGLEEGRMSIPLGFRKLRRGSLPRFLSGLTSHVFDVKTGLLRQDACVHTVKCLRELCYLFKKMQLDSDQELALDRKAKTAFFSCDNEIQPLSSSGRMNVLQRVCSFILPNLDNFEDLDCKHGPGAVAEGYTSNQKWLALYNCLSDLDSRVLGYGYDLFSYANNSLPQPGSPSLSPSRSSAKLVSVAKSSTSRRTITVEPMLNMFIQQGLNSHLRQEIEKDGILSKCLTLATQEPNQKLALSSSLTKKHSTIDLKSASDLLSNELVKKVFANRPRFLNAAMGCRTDTVLSEDSEVLVSKFAGMGNALTFPVQSTVFAVIAISAILYSKGKFPTYRNVKATSSKIHVFGDDIIVPTESYIQVVDWLHYFGLKVNQSKSYSKGNFRESCGVDAFKGHDVTPLYLRFQPDLPAISPNALENFIAISNTSWMKGLYKFSLALKEIVETRLRNRLPLVSNKSSCLGWHTRVNAYEFQRWNPTLHRFEVRSLVGSSVLREDPIDGYAALLKFYHTPLLGRNDNHLEETERRFTLKHRKRWVQAS